jgi:ribonuclease BN (tRNA processing enzyme)
VTLTELKHIFITHTHDDHLDLSNLLLLKSARSQLKQTIAMHMSIEAFAYCRDMIRKMAEKGSFEATFDTERSGIVTFAGGNRVLLDVIDPYTPTVIDGMHVFAVQSNHTTSVEREFAFNYFITMEDGTKLHYACDTGLYSNRNLEALAGAGLHILIMEATFGLRPLKEDNTHLNGEHFIRMVERMAEHGIVSDQTRIFSTHFNQEPHFMHDDLQAYFDQNSRYPIRVAYDGLVID